MARMSLILSDETSDTLRLVAFYQGVSMNAIVRDLIKEWLVKERELHPEIFKKDKIPKRRVYQSNTTYTNTR